MLMDSSFSLTNIAAAINFITLLCAIFFFFYRKFRFHQENQTVASSSSLLSTPSCLPHNWKHHVFPSFHGADVRKAFLSHFLKEFRSKGIDPFIDSSIERSKSIGPELIEAIRGSRIAIVLLSKNYASSTWCLDELVEIIKCREVLGQTVMVLFYEVDPTDIKKQTGDFGKVFKKTCKGKTEEDIREWKQALAEVAKIAGYHSKSWDDEAKMIENIATAVSDKLNISTPSSDFDDLVGMESHMINMGPLLLHGLEEVRMVGIWGPSGIGKTTIARYLFSRHSKDFQLSVFMENIKRIPIPDYSDDYSVKLILQEQFLSKIIHQEGFKIPHLGIVRDRLKDKKVFVVLDDVDRLVQLEAMAKETSWFGPGSQIIITTQDRKLLQAGGVNGTYKVNWPSSDEAFQMFCMYAFGQNYPTYGFTELAREVTSLAGKLPLGLRVLGSYFRGMSNPEDWEKALPRLKTRLDGEIKSILKFSYDALHDEEKSLFLHIVCFFGYELVDTVEDCLTNSLLVTDVTHGLDVLIDKSLISLDKGWVSMHYLLIQLGREIVRNQSINEHGKSKFLVDIRDVGEVLSDDKADTSNIIGINLWISSDNKEDISFTSEGAFEKFYNLQFLKIGGGGINLRSLDSISRKLRYLSWEEFPLPCFPSGFQPKFLVKLSMRRSQLEKLWEGIQSLTNLKWMDLGASSCLKVLPDLSTAINICQLVLLGCSSLVEFPYIGNAIHLRKLDFTRCLCLMQLPSSIGNLINLEKLSLSNCFSLVELPSSVGNLINLEELDLRHCRSLVELTSSIGNATNLQKMNLSHCVSLVELPSSIENLIKLEELNLSFCSSLVELSSSIGKATNLQKLNLSYCESLVELPSSMKNLCRLSELKLEHSSKLEVCLTNINLESLKELDLSFCFMLKIEDLKPGGTTIKEGPSSMMPLLSKLELSSCETQELGPWIRRISRLRRLVISYMWELVSLPQLPYSIEELDVSDCMSLERLECTFRNPDILLSFTKCYKLNQEARDLIIHIRTNEYVVLPGGEVPACFTYRASGSSLTVKLDQNPLLTSTKFKACFILADKISNAIGDGELEEVDCSITSKQNDVTAFSLRLDPLPEHLYIFDVEAEEVTSTELGFEFTVLNFNRRWGIKECGIFQLDNEASGE